MRPAPAMRLAEKALAALGVGIVIYEFTCPPGEQFTDGFDSLRERWPVPVYLGLTALYLHLARLVPRQLDIIGWLAMLRPGRWPFF